MVKRSAAIMHKKFAVIGLGRFGARLARTLSATGGEVIAIDRDADLVEKLRDDVALAVRLDSTDAGALKAQGVDQVDVVVVGIGEDFESSALTVATLKSLEVKHIVARAQRDIQAQILRSVGADQIVLPEGESAIRWAHRLTLPNIKEYVELNEGYSMVHMVAPELFHDKTLAELGLRNKHGLNLIAIRRHATADEGVKPAAAPAISLPEAGTKILPGDVLVLVGSNEALSRLSQE